MPVIACDDGEVRKLGEGATIIACILWDERLGFTKGAFLRAHVDGLDATGQVIFMAKTLAALSPRHVEALFLDSITTAGFNLVSPSLVYKKVGLPVIVVYKRKPRYDRIVRAARKHLQDYSLRRKVLELTRMAEAVSTRLGRVYVIVWGIRVDTARRIIEKYQYRARIPEPLRFAHLYASALSRVLIHHGGSTY
jgi:endonuclease V-like protein UPF0215 family